MDVMQKKNAAASLVKSSHRAFYDLFRADVLPVISHDVRTPNHERFRSQVLIDSGGSAEPRNPEEGRARFRIAEGGVDRSNSAIDLLLDTRHRQALKRKRVILAMSADRMAGVVDAPHD